MNRTVLVTGASRGIGRAIATAFAAEGDRLIITCSKSTQELMSLKTELEDTYHTEVLASIGDISSFEYVEQLFTQITEHFGGIDILINNAGISYIGLLTDMSIDDWNHIVSTNLTSVFSSVWGIAGASCEVAYSACKGGINSFTKALAKELAPSNIQVNAIACGVIDTQMNACFSEEERKELADEIPAGRFGTPEEVAHLAVQLANGNDYLTGQIITLDGGWL